MKHKLLSAAVFAASLFTSSAAVMSDFGIGYKSQAKISAQPLLKRSNTKLGSITNLDTSKGYSPLKESEESVLWGYHVGSFDEVRGQGYGNAYQTYDVAIYVPGDTYLKGQKILAINLPVLTPCMENLTIWGGTTLTNPKSLFNQVIPDWSLDVGYNKIFLNYPVEIPANGMYVGYSFTINEVLSVSEYYPIAVVEGEKAGSLYINMSNSDDLMDFSDIGAGISALQLFIDGMNLADNGAYIKSIKDPYAAKGGSGKVEVFITSDSNNGVHDVGYEIVVNGTAKSGTAEMLEYVPSGINQEGGFIAEFVAPDEIGSFDATIKITTVNGHPNEVESTPYNFKVSTVSRIVPRQTVVEENNGTAVGFCPRSWVGMHAMKNYFSDICNVIDWHHYTSSDAMYVGTYADLLFRGSPDCTIDRKIFTDPYFGRKGNGIISDLQEINAEVPTVDVKVEGAFVDKTYKQVIVKASTEFLKNCQGYTIAFVLTADGLSGTTSAWKQANYFYNKQPKDGDYIEELPELAEFYAGGKYGSSSVSLEFNDVLIASSYSSSKKTLVPAPVDQSVGAIAESEYTLTMPTKSTLAGALQYDKIYVTALVIDENGYIANSARVNIETEKYKITYMVDGEVYAVKESAEGSHIQLLENPEKEGYVFSGWAGYPDDLIMPDEDIIISGSFTKLPEFYYLSFVITSDSTAKVSACLKNVSMATIPSTIEIGGRPYSVTSIGEFAFEECSVISVTIPGSIETIDVGAFYGCNRLAAVNIPDGTTSIGDAAFSLCGGLTSISIPNSIINIGHGAFSSCIGLTSVVIGTSVTSIGSDAFEGCNNVKELIYAEGCKKVLSTGLTSIISVSIPNSVTSIGDNSFKDCKELTSIFIPNSVDSIGSFAFENCIGLTSITIPNSVTSIGTSAFYGCNNVKELIYAEGCKKVLSTGLKYITSVSIPNSVTNIGGSAFYGCSGLTLIDIPSSVTSIGDGAFYGCSGLTSVTIPDSVTVLGVSVFQNCSGLTAVFIGNSVTSIRRYAFSGCSVLASVDIPDSVESIERYAFQNCNGLKSITIGSSVTTIGDYAFSGCNNIKELVYAEGCVQTIYTGLKSITSVTIPNSVTSIVDYSFANCNMLSSVFIPNSVINIGGYAFSGCSVLESVDIPDSVTNMGEHAFENCSGLTSVSIGNSVENIGNYAFANCSILASVSIGNSVTSIGIGAFSRCNVLESVDIPNSVTSIGAAAFDGCSGLTSVDIPDSVTSIGNYAFRGCSSLITTIPTSVSSIGNNAFEGCTNITAIDLRASSIGNAAFMNCTSLKAVSLGEEINSIGNNAFIGCKKILEIFVDAKVPPLVTGTAIADDIVLLGTPVYVPASCISAYENDEIWGTFRNIKRSDYALTYSIDGDIYKSDTLRYKSAVIPEEAPSKEGHTFSGWSEIPETMPAEDVVITGTFSVNSYALTYKVDGEIYKQETIAYGTELVATEEPTKEGHTFSGWSEIPETMPAEDVEVTGTFSVNSYTLTYKVDGEVYKQETVAYGTELVTAEEPTKEGYTFSGWSEIPETMPAQDVEVSGTFSINMYKVSVTCNAGGTAELSEEDVAWGGSTTLTVTPDEGYEVIGVMVGSDEVTSQLVEGKYTISDVKSDITVFVMFSKSTGIDSVKSQVAEPIIITDLSGRKVQNPIKGNVYFVNGKKMLMK